MKCTDCHNTHSTSNRATLRQSGWETCVQCHVEKRGPFFFEYSAVKVEGCIICRTPHGSVNRVLLVRREERFLCLSCQVDPVAANVPHGRLSFQTRGDCTRCHALAIATLTTPRLVAQTPSPVTIGNFGNTGLITAGYRFVDASRDRPKFTELFDLNPGFRIIEVGLNGAKEGTQPFADSYSLTLSGLGGDPFAMAQLAARKTNLYDQRVSYLQSYYYWNRNDNVSRTASQLSRRAMIGPPYASWVRRICRSRRPPTCALPWSISAIAGNGTTLTMRPMDYGTEAHDEMWKQTMRLPPPSGQASRAVSGMHLQGPQQDPQLKTLPRSGSFLPCRNPTTS